MAVDILNKDELNFEIKVRGGQPASKVRELRQQLRGLMADKKEINWPTDLSVSDELDLCRDKFEEEEWRESLEELQKEPPQGRARQRSLVKLKHFKSRLQMISAAGGLGASDMVWIRDTIGYLGLVEGIVSAGSGSAATTGKVMNVDVSESQDDIEKTSDGSGTELENSKVGSPTSQHPSSYAKLPHPLGAIFKQLPVADGLETGPLLQVLGGMLRLKDFGELRDQELLRLMAPHCRGPLADRLAGSLAAKMTVDDFHAQVLNFFVPARLLDQLKSDLFYRPQMNAESMAGYIGSVKDAWRVLRLPMKETEVVGVVLEGLAPAERSRLVMGSRPRTFDELDHLCIYAHSIRIADAQRGRGEVQAPPRIMMAQAAGHPPESRWRGPPKNPVVCFGCGEVGHIRRFCPRDSQRPVGYSQKNL